MLSGNQADIDNPVEIGKRAYLTGLVLALTILATDTINIVDINVQNIGRVTFHGLASTVYFVAIAILTGDGVSLLVSKYLSNSTSSDLRKIVRGGGVTAAAIILISVLPPYDQRLATSASILILGYVLNVVAEDTKAISNNTIQLSANFLGFILSISGAILTLGFIVLQILSYFNIL